MARGLAGAISNSRSFPPMRRRSRQPHRYVEIVGEIAPELPPGDHFRLVALLRLRGADEGGRQTPVASGYRPDCWFGGVSERGERHLTGCVLFIRPGEDAFERDGALWVPPGGRCVADVLARYPFRVRDLARVGGSFDVHEGSRVVATGTINSIFDPGPEHD